MPKLEVGLAAVTGCTSGIGEAYARLLAERGHDLVLIARRAPALEKLAAELKIKHGVKVDCVVADLGDPAGLETACSDIAQRGALKLLVNNAGIGGLFAFPEQTAEKMSEMIAVNVTAVARLAQAALPALIANKGALVNVGSVVAFSAGVNAAIYSGTKGFVHQFTRALAAELGDRVQCQILTPGLTRTNLGNAEETKIFERFPPEKIMSARDCAAASIKGLELGELVCVPAHPDGAKVADVIKSMADLAAVSSSRDLGARYRA